LPSSIIIDERESLIQDGIHRCSSMTILFISVSNKQNFKFVYLLFFTTI
jgi:hypothetical protein